jgi:hypothetical protein
VGRGSVTAGAVSWGVFGTVAAGTASSMLGVACGTARILDSCVAAGVGNWAAAVDSSAAPDDSGSTCEVCASTTGGVGSGADGLGAVTAGAAPGLRLAALGANFLPVVFSMHGLA